MEGKWGGLFGFQKTKGHPVFFQEALCFIMAERQGFEPWARVTPRNGFRDRPDQPLWHLSVICKNQNSTDQK
jgi:hypothetical protein